MAISLMKLELCAIGNQLQMPNLNKKLDFAMRSDAGILDSIPQLSHRCAQVAIEFLNQSWVATLVKYGQLYQLPLCQQFCQPILVKGNHVYNSFNYHSSARFSLPFLLVCFIQKFFSLRIVEAILLCFLALLDVDSTFFPFSVPYYSSLQISALREFPDLRMTVFLPFSLSSYCFLEQGQTSFSLRFPQLNSSVGHQQSYVNFLMLHLVLQL